MAISQIKNTFLRRAALVVSLPLILLVAIPAVALFWSLVRSVWQIGVSFRECFRAAWKTTREMAPRAARGAWYGHDYR